MTPCRGGTCSEFASWLPDRPLYWWWRLNQAFWQAAWLVATLPLENSFIYNLNLSNSSFQSLEFVVLHLLDSRALVTSQAKMEMAISSFLVFWSHSEKCCSSISDPSGMDPVPFSSSQAPFLPPVHYCDPPVGMVWLLVLCSHRASEQDI